MKRSVRTADEAGNAVLLCFRDMFAAQFLKPARRLGGLLEVEQARVEDAIQQHLPIDGMATTQGHHLLPNPPCHLLAAAGLQRIEHVAQPAG